MAHHLHSPRPARRVQSAQDHSFLHGSRTYFKSLQFLASSVGKSSHNIDDDPNAKAKRKKRDFLHTDTNTALRGELHDAKAIDKDFEILVNHLFSDEKLGVDVEEIFRDLSDPRSLKAKASASPHRKARLWLYDAKKSKWRHVPDLANYSPKGGERECELGDFLMKIGNESRKNHEDVFDKERERILTSDFSGLPPESDIGIQRMPDLIGLKARFVAGRRMKKKKRHTRLRWEFIDIVIELKCGDNATMEKMNTDLSNKAFCVFQAQINRRYVLCLGFMQHTVYVAVYDRSGLLRSKRFDIHEHPVLFLRIVLGFLYGKDSVIGLDTTITKDDENETIEISGKKYDLKHVVWRGDMIRGRGTACFLVRLGLKPFVMKDVWIIRGRAPTETYFSRKAKARHVKHVATLLESVTVLVDGQPDICSLNKGKYEELQDRVHRRYLFKECGVPITHFRSQRELLQGLLDCIEAHFELYSKARLVHRDISVWNLMFVVDPDNLLDPAIRRGLLIDLEYALDLELSEMSPKEAWKLLQEFDAENLDFIQDVNFRRIRGQRTGTRPFMAWEILQRPDVQHTEKHDLESFFYVFVYICVLYNGPNNCLAQLKELPNFLKHWAGDPFNQVSASKCGVICNPHELFPEIADSFTPYFSNFKGLAEKLRRACKDQCSHSVFIEILKDAIDSLDNVSDPSSGPPPPDNYARFGTFESLVINPEMASDKEGDNETKQSAGDEVEDTENVEYDDDDEEDFKEVFEADDPVLVADSQNNLRFETPLPINTSNEMRSRPPLSAEEIAENFRLLHLDPTSPERVSRNTRRQNRPRAPTPDFKKRPPI